MTDDHVPGVTGGNTAAVLKTTIKGVFDIPDSQYDHPVITLSN